MNQTALINGLIIKDDQLKNLTIIIEDDRIAKITPYPLKNFQGNVIDLEGAIVSPGFIDIHTHGGFNVDINHASAADLTHLSKSFASQGTTSFYMSIVTDEDENVLKCIDSFLQFKEEDLQGADILGIHLEGPYLSKEYKGSMPEHLIVPYDQDKMNRFQAYAKNNIKYITVAPEVEGVLEHIPDILKQGITLSMGHSAASYETAIKAIELGVRSCTHTFNAMKLFHQHEPAIMGAVLEDDRCFCEAICDGRHLHPGTVKLLLKSKGWNRVVAITDSIMAAGLPDGRYKLGVNDIVVKNGDAKLASADVRAGSTLTTCQALRNIMEFTNEPLEKVATLLTKNPAKLMGIDSDYGSIEVGKVADMVVLTPDGNVKMTFVRGNLVFSADNI